MIEKISEATSLRPEGDRMIDSPLVSIDLPQFMKQIKTEAAWKEGKRNAITVFKTNSMRIVLIGLHEGTEMTRHTAEGIISVHILEGRIQFNTDQKSVELSKGQVLALHERIPHSVKALEETLFLLTLTKTLAVNRDHL